MRPRICELFDTTTTREYTIRDVQIGNEKPFTPIRIPDGIKGPICYLCHDRLNKVHWFYHRLCHRCGEVSYTKRQSIRDLTGHRAIVTGGRVKLGYQIALKLLRAGSSVLVTSRNWENALTRYQDEPDYEIWKDRLHVCRLDFDLLHVDQLLPSLEAELNRIWPDHPGVDIVVHNAAQTIPDVSEAPFVKGGQSSESGVVPEKTRRYPPREWTTMAFPEVDRYQRKVDRRETNTWSTEFGHVGMDEAKQVLIANAWAPFVLNQFLLPRLLASRHTPYIIHVHAKEGHFESHKTLCHMHTNMAKAAVCMMTRCLALPTTSYSERRAYQQFWIDGLPWRGRFSEGGEDKIPAPRHRKLYHERTKAIHVHGVDPGWFSVDEYTIETRINKNLYFSPIDEIDAASRVVYPIFVEAPSFPGTWRHYIPVLDF